MCVVMRGKKKREKKSVEVVCNKIRRRPRVEGVERIDR